MSPIYPNFITGSALLIDKRNLTVSDQYNLRSRLSVLEFKTEREVPKGYFECNASYMMTLYGVFVSEEKALEMLGESKDSFEGYVMIPKMNLSILKGIIRKELKFNPMYQEENEVAKGVYNLTDPPLDFQKKLIEDVKKLFDHATDKRVCITLPPSGGKTYMASNMINHLRAKFLFVVYGAELLAQNYENVKKFLKANGLVVIQKSRQIHELDYSKINGVFMTHSMLRSYVTPKNNDTGSYIGWTELNKIFNEIGITMKVIDEFDRQTALNYELDCFCNFRYSLYLTGTAFKSLKPDDRIFQSIYKGANMLGKDIKPPLNKDLIFLYCKMSPAPNEVFNIMKDDATFKVMYNNYFGRKHIILDYIFDKFYHPEKGPIRKYLDEGGSCALYVGRINTCEEVYNSLVNYHGIDPNDIGIVNSDAKYKNKFHKNIQKKFIITTTSSLGRGTDIKSLRVCIFLEFHFSIPETIQSISRVGRVKQDRGLVIMPVDMSFYKVNRSIRAKWDDGLFTDHFDKIMKVEIPQELYSNYYYGYRKDSDNAKAIEKYMKNKAKRKQKFSKMFFG